MPLHILVTGTSRGIGAAIVSALTEGGARIIGHATRAAPGIIAADLAERGAGDRLWATALDAMDGRIDVLVNNAGVFEGAAPDSPEWSGIWERSLQINLQAAADLCRNAVLHFGDVRTGGRGGRIVNVASRAAYRGDSPMHWHYAASKAGMIAMTKSIARGYAADQVYAFAVCPGFTATGMVEEYIASRGGEKLLADIPLGRPANPDEIAETIRWLATEAPPSATGAVIDVNGASYVR